MADLDAALLALAGGDSSDDEGSKPTATANKPRSPSPSPGPSHTNKPSSTKRGVAQKLSSRGPSGGSRSKKVKKADSEEGEA